MNTLFTVLSTALVLCFVFCCVISGILQVMAWSRHAREGVVPSLRALRDPASYFDEIGRRQIGIARRLLLVGGVAYLSYGFLVVASNFL